MNGGDVAVIAVMVVLFAVFLVAQDWLAKRRGPTVVQSATSPEFAALERVVAEAFKTNQEIASTVAIEVSKASVESTRAVMESMSGGGTSQVIDEDLPAPPEIPDWSERFIPSLDPGPFPNPPTMPGETPNG